MKQRTRNLGVALIVVFVLGGGLAFTAPDVMDPRRDCEIAQEWATSHASELPRSYEDLLTLPKMYRRSVLTMLPPGTISRIMRQGISTVMANPLWNEEQRALLQETYDLVSPEYVSEVLATKSNLPIALDLLSRKMRAFPRQSLKLLYWLNAPQRIPTAPSIIYVSITSWLRRVGEVAAAPKLVPVARSLPACSCIPYETTCYRSEWTENDCWYFHGNPDPGWYWGCVTGGESCTPDLGCGGGELICTSWCIQCARVEK